MIFLDDLEDLELDLRRIFATLDDLQEQIGQLMSHHDTYSREIYDIKYNIEIITNGLDRLHAEQSLIRDVVTEHVNSFHSGLIIGCKDKKGGDEDEDNICGS